MGLAWSRRQQCMGDNGGSNWNGLSPKEKQAVKKTMKKLSENVSENGQHLFLRFFQMYPAYKNYFSSFKELEVEQLRGSIILRAHGTMVIHTLSTIIDKIDDRHMFKTTLHTHIRSHFQRGVRIHNYEAMFDVFTGLLKDRIKDIDLVTLTAWHKVANMILDVMLEAITEQDIMQGITNRDAQNNERDAQNNERNAQNNETGSGNNETDLDSQNTETASQNTETASRSTGRDSQCNVFGEDTAALLQRSSVS